MKFIGFHHGKQHDYNVMLFPTPVTHYRALQIVRGLNTKTRYDEIQAGSMRWNEDHFYDYDSSFSLRIGSGDPRNTATINEMVKSGKPFQLIQLSSDDTFLFDGKIFDVEEITKGEKYTLFGQVTLKIRNDFLSVDQLTIDFLPGQWRYGEEQIIRKIDTMLGMATM